MKNKTVAAALALLMGIFGVHRFYLGQRFLGILYLIAFFITFTISMEENVPLVLAPALLGFIDAILLFVMPREDFDERYNRRRLGDRYEQPGWRNEHPRESHSRHSNPYSAKRRGIDCFRQYDFRGAIEAFEDSLEENFDDPSTHFNLACCYSMLQEADPAFYHLERAVEFGFTNLEKIHRHDALSFLRTQPVFDDFVANGYQRVSFLPSAGEPLPARPSTATTSSSAPKAAAGDDIIQQIIKLGDLREKGILTDQEFNRQKQKLLRN